jgi:hypothetical protein
VGVDEKVFLIGNTALTLADAFEHLHHIRLFVRYDPIHPLKVWNGSLTVYLGRLDCCFLSISHSISTVTQDYVRHLKDANWSH